MWFGYARIDDEFLQLKYCMLHLGNFFGELMKSREKDRDTY